MSKLLALRNINKLVKHFAKISCGHHRIPSALASVSNMTPQVKSLTQQHQTAPPSPPTYEESEEWRIIYRFPLISLASAFNRVKIPYGLLNAIVVPAAYALEQTSQIPVNIADLITAVGITSWLTLAICSIAIKNLIGIMYINHSNDRMKLAYVDYWGKRHDVWINLSDLIPEWEKKHPSKFDFYQTLTLHSNERLKFKLLQRYGEIKDPETFASIFGE